MLYLTPAQSGVNIPVSSITNVLNFDIGTDKDVYIPAVLFNSSDLEVYNSNQNAIGDCWFLETMISLYSRYPDKLFSVFIRPELMNETGIVAVKLWSKENNVWRLVIMDDYLDLSGNSNWLTSGPSGLLRNKFWVSFLEKAFAKQKSSFENLSGAVVHYLNFCIVNNMILGPMFNQCTYVNAPVPDTNLTTINLLFEYYNNGSIIGVPTGISPGGHRIFSNVSCLVYSHGYGVLDVRQNVANTSFSFIRIQNPWGQGGGIVYL